LKRVITVVVVIVFSRVCLHLEFFPYTKYFCNYAVGFFYIRIIERAISYDSKSAFVFLIAVVVIKNRSVF
jgi:hypothetical protein